MMQMRFCQRRKTHPRCFRFFLVPMCGGLIKLFQLPVFHTRAPTRADLALRLRSPQEAGFSATSTISSFAKFL